MTAHDPIAVQTGKKALADFGVPESAYQFQPKLDDARARGALRFSLGYTTTEDDIDAVCQQLPEIIETARKVSEL